MENNQYNIRVRYADNRRRRVFSKTPRVIWKSRSRVVA